jgi:hypothetical protein
MNAKITPPQADKNAILQPGDWRAVYTWEGHVFFARQLLPSPDGGEPKLGQVLLQHRTGLIPIGMQAQELICPSTDPEPIVNGTLAPEFCRTPPAIYRPCNTIDLGFRNMANCPLHGYYVAQMSDDEVEKLHDYEEVDDTKPVYHESFKFHLGMNPMAQDFMWGWDSSTKFEGTFIGHTFAFRSAADPDVLIQTYTLRPTRIPDCPKLKNKHQVNRVTSVGMAAAVVLPTGKLVDKLTTFTNATDTTTDTIARMYKAWNINGTDNNRRRRRRRMDIVPFVIDEPVMAS